MAPTRHTLNGETFEKYIALYLDGDALIFRDELMKRGVQGGVEAAQSLRSYVVESLSQKAVNLARGLGIMIYTYADVQKLATRYSKPGSSQAIELVKAQESIRDFCQGFNSAHPWSCFDDVSVSTSKKYQLRECFLQQLLSGDCLHVAFVRPTNAGFQALIDDQRKNLPVNKITTIPLPSEVLRPVDNAMSVGSMRLQVHPPPPELLQTPLKSAMLGIFHKEYASTMRYPGTIRTTNPQGEASQSSTVTKNSIFTIPRNTAGQRIDPQIDVSQKLVETVKRKKPCKNAHLLGECRAKKCKFSHEVLKGQELDALRQHGRDWPCRNESTCLDPTCYWGHMCLRGSSCDRSRCHFQKNMHVVDLQVNHYACQEQS